MTSTPINEQPSHVSGRRTMTWALQNAEKQTTSSFVNKQFSAKLHTQTIASLVAYMQHIGATQNNKGVWLYVGEKMTISLNTYGGISHIYLTKPKPFFDPTIQGYKRQVRCYQ